MIGHIEFIFLYLYYYKAEISMNSYDTNYATSLNAVLYIV